MGETKKISFRVILAIISACLIFGVIAGFRSDISQITGLISSSSMGISYSEISIAYSIYKIVGGISSILVAILVLKISNRLIMFSGILISILGMIIMAFSTEVIGFIIGLGLLIGVGSAAISFGILFGLLATLLNEKAAVVVSSIFSLSLTFFGFIFAPIIDSLFRSIGYTPMMIVFSLLLLITIPFAFILSSKKNEGELDKEKESIDFIPTIKSIFLRKETLILIVLFFVGGFLQGFSNHYYTGTLGGTGFESDIITFIYSNIKLISAICGFFIAFLVVKFKRAFFAEALVLLAYGAVYLTLHFVLHVDILVLIGVITGVIIYSMVYPLFSLIIKRKYAPVLIGSLFCFLGLFDKTGSAVNSVMGGYFYDYLGSFDLLIVIEAIVAILTGFVVLIFAFRNGDKNTELIGTK